MRTSWVPTASSAQSPRRASARLSDLLARGPVVLDGAMGTELDARGVDTHHALWSALALTAAPEAVLAVHADYLEAGARVITTNTYQATLPALIRAGHDAEGAREIIAAGVRLAGEAARRFEADHPGAQVLVAGGLGPYGAYLADGSEYTGAYRLESLDTPGFRDVHLPRIEVLVGEGVDLFALETLPRLDEARALVAMVADLAPEAECWVSFQVRPDGAHLADGTPLAEAIGWAEGEGAVVAVGINCVAPDVVGRALPVLRAATMKPLVAYPNAGDIYDPRAKTWRAGEGGVELAALAPSWIASGVRLVGGCCRTRPAQIRELAAAVGA
ncbi:homocysteine S-methyltransferase [Actinomyces viscosus]|uniref:Homocysteine S-methyltransferase n=1 Tax=Actinomyces viscosus TaxID=1656 RepID=A0A3S4V0M9_ACTVI|nr:homocysteine S-methyltransferase [Actinomyces viscosus]TFH51997.1 homocysteine S-methyltransferase [Actinomyces viscosus]VEI14466.1 Homocysteine S-methyltransferase [Actinomyces viscosus]